MVVFFFPPMISKSGWQFCKFRKCGLIWADPLYVLKKRVMTKFAHLAQKSKSLALNLTLKNIL